MNDPSRAVLMDGNEAAASVAFRCNEVCAIYPITPSTTMGELADQWAFEGRTNIWGGVPQVVEMQSEGGVAGAFHGALQTGALATTFTASQGLLLMIPNMYKIAGELSPAVIHVAARSLAAQGLSIFGDHSDVMAVLSTGFAQLASNSVQEAHDLALIAQAATLEARVPFVHFFDGFRTSHEINKMTMITDEQIRAMIGEDLVLAHRARGLDPNTPCMRGTAQNPDIYFQARETVNPYYARTPAIVEAAMDRFAALSGRQYRLFDYHGAEDAERVVILMGSGVETVRETVDHLNRQGQKLGVLAVHLFRPFSITHFMAALPASVRTIAVLDRCKEPGANGEPLYMDIITALVEAQTGGQWPLPQLPRVIGGRYGLSSKEFTPAMVKAVFDELNKTQPRNHFTIGISDDVSHTSLEYDPGFIIGSGASTRAMFFGLGADGTVGANKNSIKIIGSDPAFYAQAYFVYDSKKSGSQTVSHLRFGPQPIRAPYLIQSANFIACHQYNFLEKTDVLCQAEDGATFLLNAPYGPDAIWDQLPRTVQEGIIARRLTFYVIDAGKVARDSGMGGRINTVMQTCFFAISGVLPEAEAIERIKGAIRKSYGRKGEEIVAKNFQAVDQSLAHLHRVEVPAKASSTRELPSVVPGQAPEFVRQVTAMMMAGQGDDIPVSMLPVDGTYPTGTTQWEKRNVSLTVPVWEADICIQCGNCSFVCPHSVIRSKFYDQPLLESAPETFKSAPIDARGLPGTRYTLQVYVEDCTGCGLCVEVCPVSDPEASGRRAINMEDKLPLLTAERANIGFFERIPYIERTRVDFSTVRGVQYLHPLFEFPSACAGCGETPYIKLLSQLFGDRLVVANATGCSSIYGGNLPTTPWTKNSHGRGPAWSNSLFEDNAEFGFGFRLTADQHTLLARDLLSGLRDVVDAELVDDLLAAQQVRTSQIWAQRSRVDRLKEQLQAMNDKRATTLLSVVEYLVRRSVWIVGGDGWAYDIGSAGLDHVLSSGRDVNILVLDTEVYSNTGGQMSKATPMGAVAKFASSGKRVAKKDLAMQAISYGNVYVARVAMGANPQQTLLAFREAEAYKGPSLILAYSHCIAHGINMQEGLLQQRRAVDCAHWPLMRYNPDVRISGENPFVLDSQGPRIDFSEYAKHELRYRTLKTSNPEEAEQLMALAQHNIRQKWNDYEEMATRSGEGFPGARLASDMPPPPDQ